MSKIVWVMAAVLLGSCAGASGGSSQPEDSEDPYLIEIVADDFSFAVPETVPAGPVEIRLENVGEQPHQALTYRLSDGVTYEEYVDAVIDDSQVPALSERLGGVNSGLGTGESQTDKESKPYEPGNYAVICFVRDPDSGKGHLALGMIAGFEVTG